jgi:hypothetical protein
MPYPLSGRFNDQRIGLGAPECERRRAVRYLPDAGCESLYGDHGVRSLMGHHVEVICEWPEDLRRDHCERCQSDECGFGSRQRRLGRSHITERKHRQRRDNPHSAAGYREFAGPLSARD